VAFRHGLEESGLRLRRGAVDLVGEEDLVHHRALAIFETACLLIVHSHTGHVGGQGVGRKLNAAETAANRLRESAGERGLADAGDVLEKNVPACQKADQNVVNDVFFADENLVDAVAKRLDHGKPPCRCPRTYACAQTFKIV